MSWRSDEAKAKDFARQAARDSRRGAGTAHVHHLLRQSKIFGERAARGRAAEERFIRDAKSSAGRDRGWRVFIRSL